MVEILKLWDHPLKMTELVANLPGVYYVTRQAVHTHKHVRKAKKAIKKAFENTRLKKGLSFVEIVSNCNSGWKMTPVESNIWMEENMFPYFPFGDIKVDGIINIKQIMTEEIIIAGFGGQGVLSMGKILAYSGIMQDQEVSWMPSYGPEMRGGTANVTVILSDERISSPYLKVFDTAIILNQQSMDKFESSVKPGGILIYDPNGISHHPTRTDIKIFIKLKVQN